MMTGFRRFNSLWLVCAMLALPLRWSFAEEIEKFPEEVEKPLAELEKKAVELKSAAQMEEMNKVITEITEVTKIGDDAKKRLEKEAKGAVDRFLVDWKSKLDSRLRPFLRQEVKESLELMSQWPAEMLINSGFVPETGKLTDQEDWKNALKKIIAPEQFAMIEKKTQDLEQAKKKEIQDLLNPFLLDMRKRQELTFKTEADDLKTVLGLTGDRAKKVFEMAIAAARRNGDAIEKRCTEEMSSMKEEDRAQFNARRGRDPFRGQRAFMDEGAETTVEMADWKKALHEFLSEDEQKRWAAAGTSRQARQDKAMAMLLISHVDSKVFLTAAQREKLEPPAMKVMATVTSRERENYSVNTSYLSKFNQDELKLILDEKQMKHWQETNGLEHGRQIEDGDDNQKVVDDSAVDGDLDEDGIYSAYFHARDQKQRDRLAKGVLAKLEDIQRVVKLTEESSKRLEIASRGAAEHALDYWRPNFENWVRSSTRNVDRKTLKQRLAALNRDVNFGEQVSTFDQPIWIKAVADALTESQMELWMNEVNGRKSYHERARVQMILAELDRRYHLSLDQMNKLEPLLTQAVTEYSSDFNRMFSGGAGDMPRYMTVLLSGVPEDKTKSILSPDQFEQWKTTDTEQFKGWWENIKSSHDSRKKNGATRTLRIEE